MRKLLVHVFNNYFAVSFRDIYYNEEEGVITPSRYNQNEHFLFSSGIENINPVEVEDIYVFKENFDNIKVSLIEFHDVVETYTSDEPEFKDITKDIYEKLSTNFKQKYREVVAGKKETVLDLEVEVRKYDTDFDEDTYCGNKPSELEKLLYKDKYKPKPGFFNFPPLDLSGSDVINILLSLYKEDVSQGKVKKLKMWGKEEFSMWGNRKEDPTQYERLEVEYFVKPYNGEMKKRLHTKQNGRPYADRRGTMVPEYPEVASTFLAFSEDLDDLIQEKTDEDTLNSLRNLYKAITFS